MARVKVAALLMKNNHRGCVLAAGLMLAVGLRTSEAAGGFMSDVIWVDDNASFPVLRQQGKGCTLIDVLKTSSGYRILPLTHYMVVLLDRRKAYLRAQGYSEQAIQDMPLAGRDDDPTKMASSAELSAFVRALLNAAGLPDAFLRAAQELQARDPEEPDGNTYSDVSAYVLRRDCCTRMSNIDGLNPNEVDYLMGHRNSANDGADFQTPQAQQRLGQMMENAVLHPDFSKHPAFMAAKIHTNTSLTLQGATQYSFVAEEDVEITLHLNCMEPNNGMLVESSQKLKIQSAQTYYGKCWREC